MVTTAATWTQLPTEIRLKVIKQLVLAVQQDGGRLAPYATVCSEWQAVIETVTMRSLKFAPTRLLVPSFIDMVNRAGSLDLVRHISLFIPLAEYDCPKCEQMVSEQEEEISETTIRDALKATFTLLSTWTPRGQLALDITIPSPSDAHHHFQNIEVGGCLRDPTVPLHDPRHGWENGRMVSWPPKGAFYRPFEVFEILPDFWPELPQVAAVTSLYLRRQTTRRWDPLTIRWLLGRLVGLQEFHHEFWREWVFWDRNSTDSCIEENLLQPLHLAAPNLSKLVLFEDFSDVYIKAFRFDPFHDTAWATAERVRTPSRAVARELARAGARLRHLKHLSASYFVDARHFLRALRSPPPPTTGTGSWTNLVTLALTSRVLAPHKPAVRINKLLKRAAAVAARLPALKLMEIWNGRRGVACVFRYQALPSVASSVNGQWQSSTATITWRANWDAEWDDRVTRAREKAACRYRPCTLRVIKEVVDAGLFPVIRSHGDAIRRLGFSHDVVHPTSLSQILRENLF